MFESATAPEEASNGGNAKGKGEKDITSEGGNAKGEGEKDVASEGGNAKEESQNMVLFVSFKNQDNHASMEPRLTYLRCHISIGQRARTLCKKKNQVDH
jgi:hypothetical protein